MVFRKGSSLTLAAMTVAATTVVFFSPAGPVAADTGCPTAAAPTQVGGVYEIDTVDKLQWAKDVGQMSNNYKLTANIDMTGCTWSNGIGSSATPYTGIFDGNSKTISNLTVSGANQQNLGLIDFLNGTVSDLTLVSPSVSGTNDWKGSLAGRLGATGSISNVTATSVNISGNQLSGGLVGQAASGSTISTVSVSGIVTGTGTWAGGIAGDSQATITSAVSSVNVTGTNNVGGLAGAMSYAGTFISSRSTGNVTGSYGVAGAVGSVAGVRPSCGTLTGVTTSGTISGSTQVGGLFGAANCYFINQSSSSASVTASADKAGGLVGYENNSGDINRSFFTGQVQATEIVGGIGGLLRGQVRSTYSTGAVTATSGTNGGRAGGLIGWVSGAQVEHSFAAGIVTPPSSGSTSTTGGLFGNYASGTLLNSVWDMTASGRATSGGSFAKGFTTQQLRNYVLYNSDNLNWSITNGISSGDGVTTGTTWSICSGVASGYPFLTWQGLSGSCQPTMAYNGNGSTSGTAPSDGSTPYTSGATVTVAGNTGTLAKTGSIFAGWNTKANGSGTPYSAGDTFTITSPVMLFAQWTALPTITYASNGGLGSI
ncbi:MAG: InlB B-repeat-containing protein, partial [Ilumatobacteraceae bacterium]